MRTLLGRLAVMATLFLAPALSDQSVGRAASNPALCLLHKMTTPAKIGQILMVGIPGTGMSATLANTLRRWQPGGVILFEGNVGTAAQLYQFTAALQQTAHLPLLVATDQEGGSVVRIHVGLMPLRSEAYYGATTSPARLTAVTYRQGRALKALGVNLNLAPVMDVLDTPYSAIGSRSFGANPQRDARLVAAAVRGYQQAGIGATAKHFLALGAADQNADYTMPVVTASRAVLEARDMVPARAAVQAGVDAMMVTRVLITAFDPQTAAYASAKVVQGVIRHELGFRGLIITDSLLSSAVLSGPGPVTAALAALQAGDDLLLVGTDSALNATQVEAVRTAIAQAVAQGTVPLSRLNDAVLHVLQLKATLHLLPRC
jgi:beta-N-acetylhexosaminidase